jgi:hypothetical protein
MFEFFRGVSPNPDYWSEKLRGLGPAHKAVLGFDPDAYTAYVREHQLETDDNGGEPWTVSEAHRRLVEAGVDPYDLPPFERYSTQFLWCCHALPWAIKRYDEAAA